MKKNILKLAFAVAVGSFVLVGCSEDKATETHEHTHGEEGHTHGNEVASTEYNCPMKCEGEKTYKDKDTKCPKCGMDLVEKE